MNNSRISSTNSRYSAASGSPESEASSSQSEISQSRQASSHSRVLSWLADLGPARRPGAEAQSAQSDISRRSSASVAISNVSRRSSASQGTEILGLGSHYTTLDRQTSNVSSTAAETGSRRWTSGQVTFREDQPVQFTPEAVSYAAERHQTNVNKKAAFLLSNVGSSLSREARQGLRAGTNTHVFDRTPETGRAILSAHSAMDRAGDRVGTNMSVRERQWHLADLSRAEQAESEASYSRHSDLE